jgi:hypothetical protein
MSKYTTRVTLPAPVAHVVQAAANAAPAAGLQVQAATPHTLKCRAGITFTTHTVTVELSVAGTDGAAQATIHAHNFGLGPPQSGACRDRAERLTANTVQILQTWARQSAQGNPPLAPPRCG